MYSARRFRVGQYVIFIIAFIVGVYWTLHDQGGTSESLSGSALTSSNQTLKDDLTRASGDDAVAQRTVTTDPAASDQIAAWATAQQATAAALQHLGTDLHTRLNAEHHLGDQSAKLGLQLSDMENKVIAVRTTASTLDEVTSAQANLDSAVSDGQALVDTLTGLKK